MICIVKQEGLYQTRSTPSSFPTVTVKWAIELDFSVSEIAGWNGMDNRRRKKPKFELVEDCAFSC